jgi:hypothetical protein
VKKLVLAAFLAAVPLGAAGAMPVSIFLQKADALQAKGMMALFSSDYKLLEAEVVRASQQLRDERIAAKAAGRRPAYCPPEGKGGLGSNEILKAFHTIPAEKQPRTDVKDALRALLARKYPCPA